jgi:uncharacterized protein with beta-barrel porin domain
MSKGLHDKKSAALYTALASTLMIFSAETLAGTVTELSEAEQSVGGPPGAAPPAVRPVVKVCVGLNTQATGNTDPSVPPTQQQIAANLSADEADLLRRCADVIEAGGLGIQAQEATPESNDEARVALRQIAPDEIAAQGTTAVRAVNSQQNNVAARIIALQSGLRGVGLKRLSLNVDGSMLTGNQLQQLLGGAAGEGDSRLGAFVSGDLGFGDKKTSSREAGFDYDSRMLTAGVDYFLSGTSFIGVALGLNKVDMDVTNNGGTLESSNVSISIYGSAFRKNQFYINGFLDYSRSDHDTERNLNYTLDETSGGCCSVGLTGNRVTILQSAKGSTEGSQLTASVNMGYDLSKGAVTYGPTLDISWSSLEIDPFSESMSNPTAEGRGLALTFNKQTIDSLRSSLGFQANHTSSKSWGVFSKQFRASWHHEFEDSAHTIKSFYSFDPAKTLMTLQADRPDTDFYSLALDLTAGLSGGRSYFISYSTLVGLKDITANQFSAGLRYEF